VKLGLASLKYMGQKAPEEMEARVEEGSSHANITIVATKQSCSMEKVGKRVKLDSFGFSFEGPN
jgi:hypothetical protein